MGVISTELFRKTEGLLYRYYRRLDKLDRLERRLQRIKLDIEEIKEELKEGVFVVSVPGAVANVVNGTSSSSKGEHDLSDVMERYEKALEKLKKELLEKKHEQLRLEFRIRTLRLDLLPVEMGLSKLSEFERELVVQKYQYGRSNIQVGLILNCDEGTVRYRRRDIVHKMAQYIGLV